MYGSIPQLRVLKEKLVVKKFVTETTNYYLKTQKSFKQSDIDWTGLCQPKDSLGKHERFKAKVFFDALKKQKLSFVKILQNLCNVLPKKIIIG